MRYINICVASSTLPLTSPRFSGEEPYRRGRWLHFVWSCQWRVFESSFFIVLASNSHSAAGNLALARALGDFDYKRNEALSPEAQIITCDPEIVEHDMTDEDEFLIIACDGKPISFLDMWTSTLIHASCLQVSGTALARSNAWTLSAS